MTRSELRAEARSLSGFSATEPFSDTFVNTQINLAQGKVAMDLGWQAVSAAIAVVAGTQTPTLPTDIAVGGIVEAWWDDEPLSIVGVGIQNQIDGEWLPDPTSGTPERLIVVGATAYLDPKPSAADTLKLIYVPYLADLSADSGAGSTPTLPTYTHRWIAIQAAIRLCGLGDCPERASELRDLYREQSLPHILNRLNESCPQVRDTWSEG